MARRARAAAALRLPDQALSAGGPVALPDASADTTASPEVVDQVAVARLYGEPLFRLPQDLYIPPDALEVFLEAFEGPLDLLLYLIRKQNFNILDIPLAERDAPVPGLRRADPPHNLELASEYLLMAAMLIEIKSRMLLPPKKSDDGSEPEDPRADLVRRLVEYEQIKLGAARLDALPLLGRDFLRAQVTSSRAWCRACPRCTPTTCARPGPRSCSAPGSTSTTPSAASSCRCAST
jgi:segregation and condensation protein A